MASFDERLDHIKAILDRMESRSAARKVTPSTQTFESSPHLDVRPQPSSSELVTGVDEVPPNVAEAIEEQQAEAFTTNICLDPLVIAESKQGSVDLSDLGDSPIKAVTFGDTTYTSAERFEDLHLWHASSEGKQQEMVLFATSTDSQLPPAELPLHPTQHSLGFQHKLDRAASCRRISLVFARVQAFSTHEALPIGVEMLPTKPPICTSDVLSDVTVNSSDGVRPPGEPPPTCPAATARSFGSGSDESEGAFFQSISQINIAFCQTFCGSGGDPFGATTKMWPRNDGTTSLAMAKKIMRTHFCSSISL